MSEVQCFTAHASLLLLDIYTILIIERKRASLDSFYSLYKVADFNDECSLLPTYDQ
jgi:hypothetical protein